jgi:hypothetical protein
MKKVLIVLAALLVLAGCSKEDASGDAQNAKVTQPVQDADGAVTGETPEGFTFEADGVTIPLDVDAAPIIEALGEPVEYFEAASCAFQGLDKIYTYNGFEINTYPKEDKDYISTVYFLDDSVATDEGIYLGASLDEITAAYGEDYTQEVNEYTYTLGQTKLCFIIEGGSVSSITYKAIVDGLNN